MEHCPFDVTPLSIPRMVNNLPIHMLNYTSQDYSSIKGRIIELLKANFAEEFNDIQESSLAMMLIEVWAAMADMLSFKIDQIANELFIDTVTELENAFRLAKLVGYKPLPPLPAKAMFIAKLNSVYSNDLILKTPVKLTLPDYDIVYELYPADVNNDPVFDADIIIPAGARFTNAIVGVEGGTRKSTYTSSGKANQVITLPQENVFYNSIRVDVDGTPWQEVDYFTESSPKPQYMVEYNAHYKPSIIFGDNVAGLVPRIGSKINIRSRLPTRFTSEIISGAFDSKVFAEIPGMGGNSIVVSVKNYTKSEFGYPGDGINDIKKKLPSYLRTQNRGVTGADYKFLTDSFATPYNGVIGKSNIALRNHGCAGNVIDVIVLAKTGDHRLVKANDNLKQALLESLNTKKIFTDHICIRDGAIVLVDVHVDVYVNTIYKKFENEIRNNIAEKLEEYFHLSNWDFGNNLREKDVVKALSGVKEVSQFDVSFTTNRGVETNLGSENMVIVKYNEVISPDSININFVYKTPGEM